MRGWVCFLNIERQLLLLFPASTCSSIPQTGGLGVPCSHRCSNKDAYPFKNRAVNERFENDTIVGNLAQTKE